MSNQVAQKTAVLNEVKSILGSNFDENKPAKEQLTDEQFATLKNNVVSGIMDGSISFSKEIEDEKEISKYVSGMVSNHFRKAKELNGGNSYTPQSTGRGSRDPQLAELNRLQGKYTEGTEEFNQIASAISSRRDELAAEKAAFAASKKREKELASIDTEALPDNVRDLAESLKSGLATQ